MEDYLDDAIILPVLIAMTIKFIPKDAWERSRAEAENLWTDSKPEKWYYAIPVLIIWAVIIWLIVKAFI